MPLVLRAMVMLLAAGLAYRSLAWSLDSQLLRRALRQRRIGYVTKMGLLAAVACAIRLTRHYGEGQFGVATLMGGAFFLLIGVGLVMFCNFFWHDVREVFLYLTQKVTGEVPLQIDPAAADCLAAAERKCVSQRSCTATPQPCGARPFTTPWRPADSPRTRQHR